MKIFHQLLSIDEAIKKIEEKYGLIKPKGEESVHLKQALGRVLSKEIFAMVDSPPFDRSEVDGYAVNHLDLVGADESNPLKLKIIGKSVVSKIPEFYIERGECAEISTGAPIPKGATAVVMVEYTKRTENEVIFYKSVSSGENIAFAGSDVMMGDTTLRKGTVISSRHIAVLASLGFKYVYVFKKLNVGIISTGNEIVEPGEILPPGNIFDINQYSIGARLQELGVNVNYYGIVKDDYNSIRDIILKALEENDIVITSGSTSAGEGDVIYRVIGDMGELIVHGLKIKPGKPTIAGIVNQKLVFGLPGFPFSSIVAFEFFVRRIISMMSGINDSPQKIRGELAVRVNSSKNFSEFIPVSIISRNGKYRVYPVYGNSGSVSTMLYADGIMNINEGTNFVDENELVDITLFSNLAKVPDLTIIGSHCPLLEDIIGSNVKYIKVGSTAGWYAVKRGEANMAGTHLVDEDSGEYNLPFIEKFGLKGKAVIVRGYGREQGIIVKKGNPKNIFEIEDFLRSDVTIINRVKGSGTRSLLDLYLKKIAFNKGMDFDYLIQGIKGYMYEGKTHSSVASAVYQGRADAGIGLKYYAYLYDLDFIPLNVEKYDLLIDINSLENTNVKSIIDFLKSENIKKIIKEKYPGYVLLEDSGKIYGI
ncbi:MAG: molybdopterin biosynthesis protein [Thermoplasmata archaeon]|jgi:putative molybdopterin biosynthesis protein|nr:molybdopterin biosynthesis protein [Thermoplasmata archaeon]MVT13146.1 molybdopterin biosynthesis protein [Euryarchaeota archaeon]